MRRADGEYRWHLSRRVPLRDHTGGIIRWYGISIDIEDHLSHYDRKTSKKMYLTFSERTWTHLFENKVQYINRLQRGEWLELFKTAGFELVDEDSWNVDLGRLRVARRYANMDRHDLECAVLRVLFRKPA